MNDPGKDGAANGQHQDGAPHDKSVSGSNSIPVTVVQINTEEGRTDLRIVVVNVLPQEVTNVDISCYARDPLGLQVAEARTHVDRIAPADVAVGQVLFPSTITSNDTKFACIVGQMAEGRGATP